MGEKLHPFDDAVALSTVPGAPTTGRTTEAYANMVGPYGGITAATMLRAVLDHPELLGDPISLTVNFAAAIAYGEFTVDARPTRTNRSTQHWLIEISQDGAVTTVATAVTGLRRETWSADELAMPQVPAFDALERTVFPEFIAWAQNYDLRFAEGDLAMTDPQPSEDSTSTLWLQDIPARPIDFPALASMSDAFYPRVFLRLGQMVPAGTVSLTVYFHATTAELAEVGAGPVLGTAQAARFSGGYYDQTARLFSAEGTLLATSNQVVYFKA